MLVGYARVSSVGQSLDIQLAQLAEAGCEKTFAEKRSGRTKKDRAALADALGYVREGDVLVVTRLDRLARSAPDLYEIVQAITAKGAGLRVLQQSGIDTTTATGKVVLGVLAVIAEFEADIRKERQREGIEAAKERGVYKGRPPKLPVDKVRELRAAGTQPVDIARQLGIGRASVYRCLAGVGTEPAG